MSRHRYPSRDRATFGELPPGLYVAPGPWPRLGGPVKHDVETWRVVDDRPARVPVTDPEIEGRSAQNPRRRLRRKIG